jgi:hypothetical protein
MRPGEIYLARFPFGVMPSQLLPSDLVLDPARPELRSTNLKTLSTLRLHKLATIHTSSLVRYLGVVDGPTFNIVAKKLTVFLAL